MIVLNWKNSSGGAETTPITPSHPCLGYLGYLNLVVYYVNPDLIQNEMKKGLHERRKGRIINFFQTTPFWEPIPQKNGWFPFWGRESTKWAWNSCYFNVRKCLKTNRWGLIKRNSSNPEGDSAKFWTIWASKGMTLINSKLNK